MNLKGATSTRRKLYIYKKEYMVVSHGLTETRAMAALEFLNLLKSGVLLWFNSPAMYECCKVAVKELRVRITRSNISTPLTCGYSHIHILLTCCVMHDLLFMVPRI